MDLPEHRLPASTQVPALVRQVQGAGGFATVLHKGSLWGAALLLVHRHGPFVGAYEKLPSLSGADNWRLAAEGEQPVSEFVNKQRRFDPDLWVLELDIAAPERFVPGFPAGR
ncbi:DUF1491 family protein [Sandaracinobacter neustonicus]|nr:DUF1491 family protein [Sandaracinobacter neustonicus]